MRKQEDFGPLGGEGFPASTVPSEILVSPPRGLEVYCQGERIQGFSPKKPPRNG